MKFIILLRKLKKEAIKITYKIREYLTKISSEYLEAKQQSIGRHPLAKFIKHTVPSEFKNLSILQNNNYTVTASAGFGMWTHVPWIAILNNQVTSSTEHGYYLVYIFSEDMKNVYLSFSQGVTGTSKEDIAKVKQEIRTVHSLELIAKVDDNIYIGKSDKAKKYANSTAAYIKYDANNLPSDDKLIEDLEKMVDCYEEFITLKQGNVYKPKANADVLKEKDISVKELTSHIHSYIQNKGFLYSPDEVRNLFLSLKAKPFVILSGISGTGKTKMVQWFAESVGANEENGQLAIIPVRPDWNDGSDLLGYVDIKGEFKEGPLTKVIRQATDNLDDPYFVLLDEMNLARVEHYFSDILSIMESRRWKDGKLITSPLLSKDVTGYDKDLYLLSNVYVIGTVNMDETTHPFSKKVLDRANTIEFNRVELSNFSFLEELEESEPIPISNQLLESKYLHLKDVYKEYEDIVKKTTTVLEEINKELKIANAHVGYRVRDEICFYLAYNESAELMGFEQALDYCILQKILPRISGSDNRIETLLKGLYRIFTQRELNDDQDISLIDTENSVYPQSTRKVIEMLGRLRDDGFTSFWV